MFKKLISFSLYGQDPKYKIGMIENARLAKTIYPDWSVIVYAGCSIGDDIRGELKKYGCILIDKTGAENHLCTLWRFQAFSIENATHVILRDADSRLSLREKLAVDQWVSSNKALHIMRDHPKHMHLILGGLWGGVVADVAPVIASHLDDFVQNSPARYGVDQLFLSHYVYHQFKNNSFVHDPFTCIDLDRHNFPTMRSGASFVGEIVDQNGIANQENMNQLNDVENSRLMKVALCLKSYLFRKRCDLNSWIRKRLKIKPR